MNCKFKTLGGCLLAALALTAVLVSTASAANYTASSYPTTGVGESSLGNDVFTTEAGKVECKTHLTIHIGVQTPTVQGTFIYTSCRAFGFLNATVTGCNYNFTEPTGSADSYSAKVDVTSTCTIVAATCEAKVEPQGPLSSVAITNETAAGDMKVKANVTGIAYQVTKDGIGCPFSSTGKKTGATYTQTNAITVDSTNGATIDVG
jgi:hypothetical protein